MADERQLWLVAREGAARRDVVAEVALRARTYRRHVYAVPEELAASVTPGALLGVRDRKGRRLEAWCLSLSEQAWESTRPAIDEVVAPADVADAALIELALWAADYYQCPPARMIDAAIPTTARQPATRTIVAYRATGQAAKRAPTGAAAAVLARLGDEAVERGALVAECGATSATLRSLERRGLIARTAMQARPSRSPEASPTFPDKSSAPTGAQQPISAEDAFELTAHQRAALDVIADAVAAPRFEVSLLFGVPGSGKTEVYVRAIRAAVSAGKQAILLIPEIALATQLADRLARRFSRAVVLHSRLRDSDRRRALHAIAGGEIDVVVGTRAAVFAPCRRLGLIVVDEEQEGSFKNIASPYYHARDVAIKRGQIAGCPVVLGSATPSLETWHNAQHRQAYRILRLPERPAGATTPTARRVDPTRTSERRRGALICDELLDALRETISRGEQAILLHNRRGYATLLQCAVCGLAPRCERCGAPLVEHRAAGVLKCHRCGRTRQANGRCIDDSCGGELVSRGTGIQRLEEELSRELPGARLLRLDSDTMRHRDDYAAALGRFERREADVLIGTQMVAKGLDFPGVALVGVLDIEAALALPDFRAAERVFQLLMQVVGRAGRRSGPSLALVQSATDADGLIGDALRGDYESFARNEIELRAMLQLPPTMRLARIVLAAEEQSRVRTAAESLSAVLRELAGRVHAAIRVEDAQRCVIARHRGLARFEVSIHAPQGGVLQQLLREARLRRALSAGGMRITVDVDPVDVF